MDEEIKLVVRKLNDKLDELNSCLDEARSYANYAEDEASNAEDQACEARGSASNAAEQVSIAAEYYNDCQEILNELVAFLDGNDAKTLSIKQMVEKYRAKVTACLKQGQTPDQIAKELGISVVIVNMIKSERQAA